MWIRRPPKPDYSHVKMSWCLVQSWIQCNFGLFWPKFRYHGNSLSSFEDSDIIFWFVDPENLLFTRKMSRYLVQKRNQCNFGLTWPKFGCHGNRPCSPENSDSIFEFADLKNPTVHAKNVLTSCTELKLVQFWLFLPKFGCHGNCPWFLENSDSIFEFADPKRLLFTRKISRYVVQNWNRCNFGLFLPKFGCHGNRSCSHENSDNIFEFADPENPTIHAKSVSICCTELELVQFWHIFAQIWLPWQPPLLPWKFG